MARKITLTFMENGVSAIAEFLEREAPKTCEAIWKGLEKPAKNKAVHAMFAGREAMFELPRENRAFDGASIPPENQIILPVPGDIAFGHRPAYARHLMPEELYDIAIFYGPDCRLFGSFGWFPMNNFAKITEGLEKFAEMCAKLRTEGLKEIVISRVEE